MPRLRTRLGGPLVLPDSHAQGPSNACVQRSLRGKLKKKKEKKNYKLRRNLRRLLQTAAVKNNEGIPAEGINSIGELGVVWRTLTSLPVGGRRGTLLS